MSDPVILIPARMASTRLPGKPLADICGEPMIVHVWRRAKEAGLGPVVVATDTKEVADAVEKAGGIAVMTRLALEPQVSANWIDLPQKHFTNTVIGGRTVYTMTPRMFVAALVQYSSSNTSLSTNLRFRWEYLPGSELFVVYTEGRSTLGDVGVPLENRGLVVKFNRLFRF